MEKKNKIPFIIHQFSKIKKIFEFEDGVIPYISKTEIENLYPDFKYIFWNDQDIKDFINNQSQIIIDTYNLLNNENKQYDFFKYLILYEYGGIFIEPNFISNLRIPNKLFNKSFVGHKILNKRFGIKDYDGKWILGQSLIMCKKNFYGIKLIINNIIRTKNSNQIPKIHTGINKLHKIFVNNKIYNNNNVYIFSYDEVNPFMGRYGINLIKSEWKFFTDNIIFEEDEDNEEKEIDARKILNLPEKPEEISEKMINNNFKKMAFKLHPDKNIGVDTTSQMADISSARDFLLEIYS